MMSAPRVVAIIQARMGSTRLPGKVMRPVAGAPMIHHVVERTRRIDGVDQVVVATSTTQRERPLVDYVTSMPGVNVFRGSEDDVLGRYYGAAVAEEAEVVMRITGDCPLLSPRVSTGVLEAFFQSEGGCDYATNTLSRTFPRGLDTAVMSFEALERAHREATAPEEREHVTVYIWSNPERFALLNVRSDIDRHHLRWTVDTAEDLRFVRKVFEMLYPTSPCFEYEDVLAVLDEHPKWCQINADVEQKSVWR